MIVLCRGSSLGAEGFIVGTGYVTFSVCVALLTFAVPRMRNKYLRHIFSYTLVLGSAYVAVQLFAVSASP